MQRQRAALEALGEARRTMAETRARIKAEQEAAGELATDAKPASTFEKLPDSAYVHACVGAGCKVQNLGRAGDLCPDCDRADREKRERDQTIRAALETTVETVPFSFRWAAFGAPELLERVKDKAAYRVLRATRDTPTTIVLMGVAGVGKTILATAWLQRVACRLQSPGLFVDAYSLHRSGERAAR